MNTTNQKEAGMLISDITDANGHEVITLVHCDDHDTVSSGVVGRRALIDYTYNDKTVRGWVIVARGASGKLNVISALPAKMRKLWY